MRIFQNNGMDSFSRVSESVVHASLLTNMVNFTVGRLIGYWWIWENIQTSNLVVEFLRMGYEALNYQLSKHLGSDLLLEIRALLYGNIWELKI